ncbi:MAG: hypothetical protein E6J79_20700, partial [Deltaproteobacteria bacterium]
MLPRRRDGRDDRPRRGGRLVPRRRCRRPRPRVAHADRRPRRARPHGGPSPVLRRGERRRAAGLRRHGRLRRGGRVPPGGGSGRVIEERGESDNLRGLAKRGMAWAAVGQGGTVGLHYAIMLVLAWRLAPTEFGLVGLATIFVFTLNSVAELGLGAAIVQRRDLTPGHVAAVFWLSLAAGIGLAGGL